jgi:hypothetical protein
LFRTWEYEIIVAQPAAHHAARSAVLVVCVSKGSSVLVVLVLIILFVDILLFVFLYFNFSVSIFLPCLHFGAGFAAGVSRRSTSAGGRGVRGGFGTRQAKVIAGTVDWSYLHTVWTTEPRPATVEGGQLNG